MNHSSARLSYTQRIEDTLEKMIRVFVVILFSLMCINVFSQVILRYGFGFSFRWTIELSRYLMIWLVLVCAGPAFKYGTLVGIDTLPKKLSPKAMLINHIIAKICMFCFSILATLKGFEIISSQFEMGQKSPAMEIPMGLPYLAIPCGFIIYAIYMILLVCRDFVSLRRS